MQDQKALLFDVCGKADKEKKGWRDWAEGALRCDDAKSFEKKELPGILKKWENFFYAVDPRRKLTTNDIRVILRQSNAVDYPITTHITAARQSYVGRGL